MAQAGKCILIFASGFPNLGEHGGGGAVWLTLQVRAGMLGDVEVIGIVTDHDNGSVMVRAKQYNIPCELFPSLEDPSETRLNYNTLVHKYRPDLVVFCGWERPVFGCFCPIRTISVHLGLYLGDEAVSYYNVHEDVVRTWLLDGGSGLSTSLTINFVKGPTVDDGPRIVTFKIPIVIDRLETGSVAEQLFAAVRAALREARRYHLLQVVNHFLLGSVSWNGSSLSPVMVPKSYSNPY